MQMYTAMEVDDHSYNVKQALSREVSSRLQTPRKGQEKNQSRGARKVTS